MGDLVLKGATSGQITVTPTAIAGTNTLTLPAKTGNIITSADSGTVTQAMLASNVAGNGPAFYAGFSSSTSCNNNTYTKLTFGSATIDTNSCYSSSRFTANVAGYYLVGGNAQYQGASSSSNIFGLAVYKNGTSYREVAVMPLFQYVSPNGCIIVQLNINEYVELWALQVSGSTQNINGTAFWASMVRAA